ncbi:hypothetical protein BpHYR1_004992 [Brachionus plicatilis]|uniref:Uncharacterized protein n=1 Tax=Brachionus plicatilis TaxID=10195 RepID=A0A3M7S357_BRAPC|nr:hypothetical protein BpHYR1_004992 [Brachionus plicatilis]
MYAYRNRLIYFCHESSMIRCRNILSQDALTFCIWIQSFDDDENRFLEFLHQRFFKSLIPSFWCETRERFLLINNAKINDKIINFYFLGKNKITYQIITIKNIKKYIKNQNIKKRLKFGNIRKNLVGGRSRGHVAGQKKKMAETVAGRASGQKTDGPFNGQ